jgi:hypothetical protein
MCRYVKAGDVSLQLDVIKPKAASGSGRPSSGFTAALAGGNKSGSVGRLAALVATGDYVGVSVG